MSAALRRWDTGVVAITLFQSTVVVLDGASGFSSSIEFGSETARTLLVLAPLAAFVLLYVVLGRGALRRGIVDAPIGPRGTAFLVLLVGVLACAVFLAPMNAIMQAIVYPLVWTIANRYRDAVAWSGATAAAIGAAMYSGLALAGSSSAFFTALLTLVSSFVFAVVMGTWITRVFEQGERFRLVADQLRDAQGEVSTLSEAAGAAAERERLSRELHDTLTQTLTGLVMLSEQAERALDAQDPEAARQRITQVASAARAAVGETRALVATTHPLADGGLEQAIERLVARVRAETGISVDCSVEAIDCGREQQVVLLRAAQEGLANVRKHARATAATVTLRLGEDPGPRSAPGSTAVLTVTDDGIGPGSRGPDRIGPARWGADGAPGPGGAYTAADAGGYGLTGLRDRARHVRGDLSFGPGPHGGARLELRLPLTPRTDAPHGASPEPPHPDEERDPA